MILVIIYTKKKKKNKPVTTELGVRLIKNMFKSVMNSIKVGITSV